MAKKPYISSDDPAAKRMVIAELRNAPAPDINRQVQTTQGLEQPMGDITVVTGIQTTTQTPDGTVVVVRTDKDVYVNTYEVVNEQKYIKNGMDGTLSVGYMSGNTFSETVPAVNQLGFNVADGFSVVQTSTGVAKISMPASSSGYSGASGAAGNTGITGTSGWSGWSGLSGGPGASGYSGSAGTNGTSGYSGIIGSSGYSGSAGTAGASGFSGWSGSGGGSVAIPLTEIAVGTGTGISGYSGFTYDMGKNAFHVNYPGTISNDYGEVVIRSSSSVSGYGYAQLYLTSAIPSAASSVFLEGGDGDVDVSDGGNITVWSGTGYSGAPGGDLYLYAGDGGQQTGRITIEAGWALDDAPGTVAGDTTLRAGAAYSDATSYLYSGGVIIEGGQDALTNTDSVGGHVVIRSGMQSFNAYSAGRAGVFLGGSTRAAEADKALVVNSRGALGFTDIPGGQYDAGGAALASALETSVQAADYGSSGYFLKSNGQLAQPEWTAMTAPAGPLRVLDWTASAAFDAGSAADHWTHNIINLSGGGAVSITIQPDSFWSGGDPYWYNNYNPLSPGPMPVGGVAEYTKVSAGNVTFIAGSGVTILNPNGLVISTAYGSATLRKTAANYWVISGDLTP